MIVPKTEVKNAGYEEDLTRDSWVEKNIQGITALFDGIRWNCFFCNRNC
jgi:hypothetical protein